MVRKPSAKALVLVDLFEQAVQSWSSQLDCGTDARELAKTFAAKEQAKADLLAEIQKLRGVR